MEFLMTKSSSESSHGASSRQTGMWNYKKRHID